MKWYIPTWNGDIRFQMDLNDPNRTLITVIQPTPGEIEKLRKLTAAFKEKEWITRALWSSGGSMKEQVAYVDAPILDVAPFLVASYKPGKAVLTALKYDDGTVEAIEQKPGFWAAIGEMFKGAPTRTIQEVELDEDVVKVKGDHAREVAMRKEQAEKKAQAEAKKRQEAEAQKREADRKRRAKAATTVSRPTVCCPRCVAGDLTPAGEVLYAFLAEDEKRQWEKDHSIIVYGGITGHAYLISHRHGRWAIKHGKICQDLTNGTTLHFHDHSVPPEEEVLAAKLILEHREHWLRVPGTGCGNPVLPSPFGNGADGTRSTSFTYELGGYFAELVKAFTGEDPTSDGCLYSTYPNPLMDNPYSLPPPPLMPPSLMYASEDDGDQQYALMEEDPENGGPPRQWVPVDSPPDPLEELLNQPV